MLEPAKNTSKFPHAVAEASRLPESPRGPGGGGGPCQINCIMVVFQLATASGSQTPPLALIPVAASCSELKASLSRLLLVPAHLTSTDEICRDICQGLFPKLARLRTFWLEMVKKSISWVTWQTSLPAVISERILTFTASLHFIRKFGVFGERRVDRTIAQSCFAASVERWKA